jgi:hypothetical protein
MSSSDQWDAWYTLVTGLGDGAEPFELLVTLAQELRNEGVPFAEKWGESPNVLQPLHNGSRRHIWRGGRRKGSGGRTRGEGGS